MCPTPRAGDMIAASNLFDVRVALWAGLDVVVLLPIPLQPFALV